MRYIVILSIILSISFLYDAKASLDQVSIENNGNNHVESWNVISATAFAGKRILSVLGIKLSEEKKIVDDVIHEIDDNHQVMNAATIESMLIEAKTMIIDNKFNASISLLLTIIEHDPHHIECLRILGAVLLSLHHHRIAEDILYTAVSLSNWTDIMSICNLAEAMRLNDDVDMAMMIINAGFTSIHHHHNNTSVSDDAMLRYIMGNIMISKHEYHQASQWYLSSAMMDQHHIHAWLQASTLSYPIIHRNVSYAMNVLSEAIMKNPDDVTISYYLGIALHLGGYMNEAIILYENMMMIYDDHQYDGMNIYVDDVRVALATAYEDVGRYDDAMIIYKQCIDTSSSSSSSSGDDRSQMIHVHVYMNYARLLCTYDDKSKGRDILHQLSLIQEDDKLTGLISLCAE